MSGFFKSEDESVEEEEEEDGLESTSFRRSVRSNNQRTTNEIQLAGNHLLPSSFINPGYDPDEVDEDNEIVISVSNTQISVIESTLQLTPDSTPCFNHQFKLNGSCLCHHSNYNPISDHQLNSLTKHQLNPNVNYRKNPITDQVTVNQNHKYANDENYSLSRSRSMNQYSEDFCTLKSSQVPLVCLTPESIKKGNVTKSQSSLI